MVQVSPSLDGYFIQQFPFIKELEFSLIFKKTLMDLSYYWMMERNLNKDLSSTKAAG